MEHSNVIGVDLAKNVFQLHIADRSGKKIKTMRVKRDKLLETFTKLPASLVGMEACSSSHHWAREIEKTGHKVKMMAPQYVKPYVLQGNKTDAKDAAAICEAASRHSVPQVRIRSVDEQQLQALHRARESLMKQRVATGNQIRGLLGEMGYVIPVGFSHLLKGVPAWLSQENNPGELQMLVQMLFEEVKRKEEQMSWIESRIKTNLRENANCRLIESVPGVGALSATAVVASVGNANEFKSGRQLASFFGLTPREHSSGETQKRLGISKRGNVYVRTLLIQGARTVIMALLKQKKKGGRVDEWLERLIQRRGMNCAAVALAAKNVRRMWAMLQTGEFYDGEYETKREWRTKKAA